MKPMIYNKLGDMEILDNGIYNGYQYWIVSYGSHPCAYVQLPKNHLYYGKGYDNIPINCHGGLTFSGEHESICDGFLIGWDYAHAGDYHTFANPFITDEKLKRWTTEEILGEVMKVITQLCIAKDSSETGLCPVCGGTRVVYLNNDGKVSSFFCPCCMKPEKVKYPKYIQEYLDGRKEIMNESH